LSSTHDRYSLIIDLNSFDTSSYKRFSIDAVLRLMVTTQNYVIARTNWALLSMLSRTRPSMTDFHHSILTVKILYVCFIRYKASALQSQLLERPSPGGRGWEGVWLNPLVGNHCHSQKSQSVSQTLCLGTVIGRNWWVFLSHYYLIFQNITVSDEMWLLGSRNLSQNTCKNMCGGYYNTLKICTGDSEGRSRYVVIDERT